MEKSPNLLYRTLQPPGFAEPAPIPGLIGLVQCSGDRVSDLVSKKFPTVASGCTPTATSKGIARATSGATQGVTSGRRAWPIWEVTSPFTLVAYWQMDSVAPASISCIGYPNGYYFFLLFGTNRCYGTAGGAQVNPGAAWPLGRPIASAMTYSGGVLEGWFNGVSEGSAVAATPTYATFDQFVIGGQVDQVGYLNGKCWYVALFNRKLTGTEIVRLAKYPFSIYAPYLQRSYVYSSAAANNLMAQCCL